MQMTAKQHGGKREGAGRPKGSLNRRSLAVIEEVAERYPHWSPLLHLASVANDETLDPEIRLDAAKAAAPYCHAKLRPVVADADELVELEGRIAAARAKATVKEITGFDGLAERLSRARAREDLTEAEHAELTRLRLMRGNVVLATGVPRAPDESLTIDATIASLPVNAAPATVPTPAENAPALPPDPPGATGADAIIAAKPPDYEPIMPDWPRETQFVECDYETFGDGLLAGRNS